MKVGVFYLSYRNGPDRQVIYLKDGTPLYIRVDEINCKDEEAGLDKAKTQAEEMLMNTHELPS